MPESANKTTLTPTFITDATGSMWGLTPSPTKGTQICHDGNIDTSTANVTLLLYFNQTVYYQTNAGNWYMFSQNAWIATPGDPRVAKVESPDGTSVTTVGPAIISAAFEAWTLVNSASSGVQIAVNGVTDTTTAIVVMLYYKNHTVYQTNTNGGWWYKAKSTDAWTSTTDPRNTATITGITLSNSSIAGGAPSGTVVGSFAVTMSAGSFSGTLALSGTNAALFKLVGNNLVTATVVSAGSYSIDVTATQPGAAPYKTTFGITASSTSNLILVPLGAHISTWFGNKGSNFYADFNSHWNGFVSAFGRTPSIIGEVGTNANSDPSNWPGIAQYNINSWPSAVPPTTTLLLAWLWQNAAGTTIYSDVANGSCDSWIQQTLAVYKNNGKLKLYIRPSWEWNTNFTGNGINSNTVGSFIACWKHFANVCHSYAAANGMTIRLVWCPAIDGGSNGLTLASQFPTPDSSAIGGKYVDVVAPDTYAFGNPLVSNTTSNSSTFLYRSCVALAQQYKLSIGVSELGGNVSASGGSPVPWIQDAVNWFASAGPSIPIEYLSLWDVNTTPGQLEFTHPSSINYPLALNAWKVGVGPSGSIRTLPT